MKQIRTGVVGVGHLGYHHARIYSALDDVELIGIVDTDPAQAQKGAGDFKTQAFDSVEALIEAGVDAVSVAVPTSFHLDIASRLLAAGVDVLVEKPLAGSVEEGRALVATAQEHGRLLQVGHIERFNGAVQAFLDVVKKPRFIECHRLSPYPNRGQDVSVVLDLMIHDLEILGALVKSAPVSVDAVGVAVFSPQEDIANARIRFESGCVANVTASRVSVERMRKIRIFEADAYMSTDYSEQQVMVYRKKPGVLEPGMNPMEFISVEPLPVYRDEPLRRELASFVGCVRERTQPLVTGEAALAAMELAERITESIRVTA